jgi:hypothetical protein
MTPLGRVQELYADKMKLALDDRPTADFLMALSVANQMKSVSDPLWCWFIGPPGSGKNESMRVFRSHPTTFFLSALTPNALMSGHRDDDDPDRDPSLLPELNGKTLFFEETGALLEMGEGGMNKVMADLRNMYGDEPQSKSSGSAGVRTYQSRFGIVFGATPAIDSVLTRHQQLGARMVAFRIMKKAAAWPLAARMKYLAHVQAAMAGKTKWRDELKAGVQVALDEVLAAIGRDGEEVSVDEGTMTQLLQLADLVARLRTVPVEGMSVDPEPGTRLIQQFLTLGRARALCDGRHEWTHDDTQFVQRVAGDTLPRWVVELLCLLSPPVEDVQDARPRISYFSGIMPRVTAVDPAILALYIRQYKHLGILTRESLTQNTGAANDAGLQLSTEALDQLYHSGLLFGERGT